MRPAYQTIVRTPAGAWVVVPEDTAAGTCFFLSWKNLERTLKFDKTIRENEFVARFRVEEHGITVVVGRHSEPEVRVPEVAVPHVTAKTRSKRK